MHGHFHAVQRVPLFSWAYAHCCILYRFLLFWNKYSSKLLVTVPVQTNLILMFVRALYKKQVVHCDLVNIGLIVKKFARICHCYPVNYFPVIKGGRKLSHTMMSIHQQHCIYRAVLDFSTLNIHLLSLATLHLQGGIGF